MSAIGYYIHHHGDGHRQRALSVAATDPERFTLIGTGLASRTGAIATLDLPDDRITRDDFDGVDDERHRPAAFHYAPLNHDAVRKRMSLIADWIAKETPALMIVDVSVEIALFARLCSTPVAYVRLSGRRDDTPHLEAFRAASVLIAPFAEVLDASDTPDWVRKKTIYAPGLGERGKRTSPEPGRVLVVIGRGGSSLRISDIAAAAEATPDFSWRVIGLAPAGFAPANMTCIAWSDDPLDEIGRADLVVGAAGDGLVGAVIAARKRFVCIPEPRPFGEQVAKAEALGRVGGAVVQAQWPAPGAWPALFAQARAINPSAQAALDHGDGPNCLIQKLQQAGLV